MKNVFFILVLAIGLMSFTSSNEVNNDLISSDLTISKGTVDLNTNITTVDWACCTVSNSSSEVTVCRADGNSRRACRRARRLLNQQ
jgi:hypothetical protein